MPPKPSLTLLDRSLAATAAMLFTLFARPRARRDYPATAADAEDFSVPQRRAAGRYMRVNHVGEVCAQALYQSQAVTAQNARLRQQMHAAASEETDHLAWCERRLEELGGRKSVLNPLWYGGAFALGAVAGLAGDRWNLGLVVETERQVVVHLDNHLGQLPQKDCRSRQIVTQMRQDEQHHAEQASAAGAAELPPPFKHLMRLAAKVMTSIAHWI